MKTITNLRLNFCYKMYKKEREKNVCLLELLDISENIDNKTFLILIRPLLRAYISVPSK